MSYDNAEPKTLKTLNSNGQVLNDSGEVISDTSDYWEKVYNEAEPKPDKILHSDGTIKDSAGNVIQDSTPFNVKKYNQTEPIPAKYLHSDGTIDENPGSGGGGSDLEDNHQTTIDVSAYTEPVEITPTAGKDGMKKATVTLSNIPSGGGATVYAWETGDIIKTPICLNIDVAPNISDDIKTLNMNNGRLIVKPLLSEGDVYTYVSDTQFTITNESGSATYTRNNQVSDVQIWG